MLMMKGRGISASLTILLIISTSLISVTSAEEKCSKKFPDGGLNLVSKVWERVSKLEDELDTLKQKSRVCCGEPVEVQCELLAECDSQVPYIKGLHEDIDGTIIVSGSRNHSTSDSHPGISRCSITGQRLGPIPQIPDNSYVEDAVVTSDGTMWAATEKARPYRLVGGQWERMFEEEIPWAWYLDTDSDRNLVLEGGDSGTAGIYKINATGVPHIVSSFTIDGGDPRDISVLPSGNIAVLSSNKNFCVHIMSPTGTVLNKVGKCEGDYLPGEKLASGFGNDRDGNILAVLGNEKLISRYTNTGVHLGNICAGMFDKRPETVMVTSQGKLVVGMEYTGKVKIFNYKMNSA